MITGLLSLVGLAVGSSTGCAAIARWGHDWADLGEPLQAWGSEIVGYEDPVY